MIISQDMLELLRTVLNSPDLQLYAKADWGSDNPDYRRLLHAERDHLLSQSSEKLYSSLSHTKGMGFLAISSKPLGVDVEVVSRVQEHVIARVSNSEELGNAPSGSSLWTAKEAAFKATREYNQPSVISDISIGAWRNIESQVETFSLLSHTTHGISSERGGVCFKISDYCFGIFVAHS